jgi:hypothetical protein
MATFSFILNDQRYGHGSGEGRYEVTSASGDKFPCDNLAAALKKVEDLNLIELIQSAEMSPCRAIKLHVAPLFANTEFQAWLESSKAMTWHQRGLGAPTEDDAADVAIFVDPSLCGDGSDSDMPGHDLVVDRLKAHFGAGPFSGEPFIVILSNT